MAAEKPRNRVLLAVLALVAVAAGAANGEITTVTYQVSSDSDDGYAWSATDQNTTAAHLIIGDDKTYYPPYHISAMRFTGLSVPRSAAVVDARLKIRSLSEGFRGQVYGVIQAESADDVNDFSSRYIASAAMTAASVDWDHKDTWVQNTWQTSPDISGPVQEVVSRAGWSSGNAIAVFYITRLRSGKSRLYASVDLSAAYAPVLELTYQTYAISGYVRTSSDTPIAGATISAGSDIEGTITDTGGYYELKVPPGWSGTVTVSKADWGFAPPSRTYSSVAADQTNQDYTGIQPKISGYITDRDSAGVEGVTVSADNGGGSDTTDAGGYYEITVPYGWSGTVTPVKAGWDISPASWTYGDVVADQTNQDYSAFQPRTSGRILDANGVGFEGAVVSADNGGDSDTTDANGYYELTVPYNWSGTITPSKTGWGFNPGNKAYSNVTADQTNQDYAAFQPTISGYLHDLGGAAMTAVVLSANNGGGSDTTDANGYYEFAIPYNWSGTVTPAKVAWGFTPANKAYSSVISNQTGQDYTGFQPAISGHVRDVNSIGMEGVLVSANNGGGSDTTDANGYYQITVPYAWSGTVTPAKADWGFSPANRPYSNVTANQVGQDYTGFQPIISGYVRDANGIGLEGVLVSADGGGGSHTTDATGYYDITVPYNWSGTVTPDKTGWGFTPSSRAYSNVVSDKVNQDYSAFQPKISGYVTDRDGAPVADAAVSADNGGGSDIAGADGYYEVTVPYGWSGTVTATKAGWDMSPSSRVYSNVIADQTSQDYSAFQPRISGYVTQGTSGPAVGVTLSADAGGGSDTTDLNGNYEFAVPYNWSGTVTPDKTGWGFDPLSRTYSNVTVDEISQDYTAFQPVISGYVTDTNGAACVGFVVATDDANGSDVTDSNGYYEFAVPYNWSGTVIPQKLFWFFEPANRAYSNLIADAANQDYTGIVGVSISGTVVNFGDVGIPGVEVSADNGGRSDTTDAGGFYELAVPPGWSGTVTPNKPGRNFWPVARWYDDLTLNVTDQIFLALPLTVRADGTGGFPTIQAAIDEALDGDKVLVEPGTYTGLGNRDIDFLGKAITVQGLDPADACTVAATIIDCEGAGRGFYFHSYEQANSILDGLTITNGHADYGGGIHCSSSPTISNCIIKDNTATAEGGGVYGCSGSITKCTITGNSAVQNGGGLAECYRVSNCSISNNSALRGGGIWCNEFDPILTGCEFSWNSASNGGGLSCMYGSNPTLANCAFVQNSGSNRGGGIYNHEAYAASITSCIFIGNSAAIAGGGMYDEYGGGKLTSCVFSGNSASDGGGIYHYYSGLPISNCTFSGNSAVSAGGGIYGDPDVDNCILWGNTDSSSTVALAQIYYDSMPEVTFSCIQDDDASDANIPFGGADSNNIDDYPMFVHDANDGGDGWGDDPQTLGVDEGANDDFGDLHLLSGSPCINVGNPFSWIGPEGVDIDGEPRLMGGTIDMGADEFPYPRIVVTKPQGGEVWVSESSHQITWLSEIYEGPVDILFSSNGGTDRESVQAGAENTGSYLWHLPAADSNQCVIAVVPSVPDPNVNTTESGLFTIHPDSPGPPVTSKWQSLGGDYDRLGRSDYYGPVLGCIKWEFEVDGAISASVTIGPNDTVYVPCEDGNLYKLDSNGVVLWSYDANSPLISSPSIGPDGTVYVGSKDGRLFAVDIDGNVRWTHTTAGMLYSSPAVSPDGNSVYVGSQDGKVYALGRDGSELWSFETAGFGVIDGSVFASPAIGADGAVYIGGFYEPNLYALDPNDGSVKWVCNFEHFIYPHEPQMGTEYGWLFASPVVGPNGTIYQVLLYDPNLYAIDPNDGSILWGTNLSDIVWEYYDYDMTYSFTRHFEPYYYEDVYCDIRRGVFRYYNARYNVSSSGWSEPVIGPDGTIYVNFDDPWLRAVEPNGAIKWIRQIGGRSGYTEGCDDWGCGWFSNGYGTMGFSLTVDSDGVIYAAGNDSNLYVVNPDGLEIARFDSNDFWLGFPVISADNTVIFGDSRDNSMLISYGNNKVWAIGGDDCQGQDPNLYWQGGAQDLDGSATMDLRDLAILAQQWQKCTDCRIRCYPCRYCYHDIHFLPGDINKDFYVNFGDVAILAEYWLWGY